MIAAGKTTASKADIGTIVYAASFGRQVEILDFTSHLETGLPYGEYLVRLVPSVPGIDPAHMARGWIPVSDIIPAPATITPRFKTPIRHRDGRGTGL